MAETLTIEIRNKKVKKVLGGLEEVNMIRIINTVSPGLSSKKKRQARNFLKALKEAKLAEKGKIKLKTIDELINEC